MFDSGPEPGGDEQRSYFVSVQADGVGFVIDPRPTDVNRGRVGDEAFLFGVAVEARHGAQSATDGGRCSTPSFQLPPVGLDVASDLEETQVAVIAEGNELTKIQRIGVAGEPSVAAEEPGEGDVFRTGKFWVVDDDRCGCGGRGIPPSRWDSGTRRPGPRWMRSLP
jgi:hypothetical protein